MKIKYGDIDLHSIQLNRGHEVHYFTCYSHDGYYFEWQKGARTINLKSHASYQAQDLDCFGMDPRTAPTMRNAKSCIVEWINENQ